MNATVARPLSEVFLALPDRRQAKGGRHQLSTVRYVVALAMINGQSSLRWTAYWAQGVDHTLYQHSLRLFGYDGVTPGVQPFRVFRLLSRPSRSRFLRGGSGHDPDAVVLVLRQDLEGRTVLRGERPCWLPWPLQRDLTTSDFGVQAGLVAAWRVVVAQAHKERRRCPHAAVDAHLVRARVEAPVEEAKAPVGPCRRAFEERIRRIVETGRAALGDEAAAVPGVALPHADFTPG